jgi:hypothetical protein
VSWNNYKIVKDADGYYYIRKGWVFHKYMDQKAPCWWGHTYFTRYRADCKISQFDKAKIILDKLRTPWEVLNV